MFKISLLQCFSEGVGSTVGSPMVEWVEAFYHVVVGVIGQILGPEFENDINSFEQAFMGAMRTHDHWMTPKVHMLVHHVPEYVRRSEVPFGRTSEQALEIQRRFF